MTPVRGAVMALGRCLRHGTIVLHEGQARTVVGSGDPVVDVTVNDARAYRELLRGSRGLGDAYVRGWWDSDDPTSVVRVLMRSTAGLRVVLDRLGAAARPILDPPARLRRSDKATDRRNIRAHYDIGNDLFELMLDETMTYSCALFGRPDMPLVDAQTAKLDRICQLLDLSAEDHVVEIGTGWGGFAVHAATRFGCRVTTTTISAAQHDYAAKRIAEAGLSGRVTLLDADYRELTGTFDKLVSIEMIEAVDWRDHDRFFDVCARLLVPGGRAALQAIVIADESFERAKHHDDFVRRAIFPGGCLPSVSSIRASALRAGLRPVELSDIGDHYPETLRRWRSNLADRDAEVSALRLPTDFRRLWNLYLAYCEAAFLERHVSDVQLLLTKPAEEA